MHIERVVELLERAVELLRARLFARLLARPGPEAVDAGVPGQLCDPRPDRRVLPERVEPGRVWAKEAVFSEEHFAGAADRGVEMRSTGEVMASGPTAPAAYRRALQGAGRARAAAGSGAPLQGS